MEDMTGMIENAMTPIEKTRAQQARGFVREVRVDRPEDPRLAAAENLLTGIIEDKERDG